MSIMQKTTRMLTVLVAVFALIPAAASADGTAASSRTAPQPPPGGYPVKYRLMFVTEAGYDADQTDIAWYHTAVNNAANNLGGETGSILTNLAVTWRCIGSTSNISARVHSKTLRPADQGYDADWDLPIYNLAGELKAANNAAMWDGSLDGNPGALGVWDGQAFETGQEPNPLAPAVMGTPYQSVWTGTGTGGDIYPNQYLGHPTKVRAARGERVWSGDWISWGSGIGPTTPRAETEWLNSKLHLYGLSDPITAPAYTLYTLTFDPHGGTVGETNRQVTGLYGELYGTRGPLPTVTPPEGQIFCGWFEDAAATGPELHNWTPLVISADKTIYAKLQPLWNGPEEPLVTDGLLGYWSFNDNTADDRSGNNYHGTWAGTAVYSSNDIPHGFGGASIDLTSGNNSIGVSTGGNEDIFDTQAHSIAFWTKGAPNGDWGNWITKTSETDGFMIRQHTSTKTTMYYDIRGGGGDLAVAINHADNEWHHYVMTYDSSGDNSGTKKIYQDGAWVATGAGRDPPPSLRTLAFGDRDNENTAGFQPAGGTNRTKVRLDEIYFFNRALTPEEVTTLYTQPTPAGPPGTLIIVR